MVMLEIIMVNNSNGNSYGTDGNQGNGYGNGPQLSINDDYILGLFLLIYVFINIIKRKIH